MKIRTRSILQIYNGNNKAQLKLVNNQLVCIDGSKPKFDRHLNNKEVSIIVHDTLVHLINDAMSNPFRCA